MTQDAVEGYELSFQQKDYIKQKSGSVIGTNKCLLSINRDIDLNKLKQIIEKIISDQEIFRTKFQQVPGMSVPLQVISEDRQINIKEISMPDISFQNNQPDLEDIADYIHDSDDTKLNFKLLTPNIGNKLLLISTSALMCDEVSFLNFVEELSESYRDIANDNPLQMIDEKSEVIQYVDFSEWQNSLFEDDDIEQHLMYWKEKLNRIQTMPLPDIDFGNNTSSTESKELNSYTHQLGSATFKNLQSELPDLNSSDESIFLSIWLILISKLTGNGEFGIDISVDGRGIENLEDAFGLYSRFVPHLTSINEKGSFRDFLEETESELSSIYENQYYFSYSNQNVKNEPSNFTPQNISFNYLEISEKFSIRNQTISVLDIKCSNISSDLHLNVIKTASEIKLKFYFNNNNFSVNAIAQIAKMFEVLLHESIFKSDHKIKDLGVLTKADQSVIADKFNKTSKTESAQCLHRRFEEQVKQTPDEIAVNYQDIKLSFADLNKQANQLANYLLSVGINLETPVGVLIEKSDDLVRAILAIWKIGGVYIPLDLANPSNRLNKIIETSQIKHLITTSKNRDITSELPINIIFSDEAENEIQKCVSGNLNLDISSHNLAYIIYTSGSTGLPKGVLIEHKSVNNLIDALNDTIYDHLDEHLQVGINAPIVFDASIKQLIQIVNGHTLIPIPEDIRLDPENLAEFTIAQEIEVLDCTPSQLNLLLDTKLFEKSSAPNLKVVLIGGENIPDNLWRKLSEIGHIKFFNVYGPTECTVDTTVAPIKSDTSTSLGSPINNVKVYLLDKNLTPVPIGMKGEICIAGEGIARGYLNDVKKTSESFLPDVFSNVRGARMYRTGDIGRYTENGNIEFVGRIDNQVKIRGYRVELGEIERVLEEHPGIKQTKVVFNKDKNPATLVAYSIPHRKFASHIDGAFRYELPNKLVLVQQNKNETDYLFEEIFEKRTYLRRGITLPEQPCIVDVGANIGMFTLFILQNNPSANIYAFEALPPIYEKLRLNTELYGENVNIYPIGISNENKTDTFTFYPQYSMMSGLSSYASSDADTKVIETYLENQKEQGSTGAKTLLAHSDSLISPRFEEKQSLQVQLITLSEFIEEKDIEFIDLLKIDVQRAEMDVLEGINHSDWKKIQQIVMEVHDAVGEESEGRLDKICDLMQKHGFQTLTEQDEIMKGTDRYNLYASKNQPFPIYEETETLEVNGHHHQNSELIKKAYPLDEQQMRDYLRENLPEYMVPNLFVLLEKMPLNENGKIDIEALPEPDINEQIAKNFVTPTTEVEKVIATIWQDILNLEKVGIHDNFFDLGGHSLLIVQLHSEIRKQFDRELAMVELFQYPTIHSLAERLSQGSKDERITDKATQRAKKQREMINRQKKSRNINKKI